MNFLQFILTLNLQGCHSESIKKEKITCELQFSAYLKKNYALILFYLLFLFNVKCIAKSLHLLIYLRHALCTMHENSD